MTPVATHKAAALGAFRSSVFFIFAVAAFMERDQHTATVLITAVFLLDVASWHLCEVVSMTGNIVYNQTWLNVLANRFITQNILEKFRDRQTIDFETIVQEGTKAAGADVAVFLKDHTMWSEWGTFKKSLAGIGLFLMHWVSYGIFYGIAGTIGTALRGS
jgi:hypothetical protein